MIKIGFIDYYLDEWHANNYPNWIKEIAADEAKVAYCWGEIDSPKENGLTNAAWAEKFGVELCASIEEVVEKSDVLCILSPDNAEKHEGYAQIALKAGKTTYIDKTFAPEKATAERIFAIAEKYNTPVMTSSALRFATEYQELDKEGLATATSFGGGYPDIYMIHQLEPLVMLFGTDAKRVINVGSVEIPSFVIEYADGRRVNVNCVPYGISFQMLFAYKNKPSKYVPIKSDFFRNFIKELITYYKTSEVTIPHEQTLAVMTLIEYCVKAKNIPDTWVEIEG